MAGSDIPVKQEETEDDVNSMEAEVAASSRKRPKVEHTEMNGTETSATTYSAGILFSVRNISKLTSEFTPKIEVAGVPWRARIERIGLKPVLYLYSMIVGLEDWSIDSDVEYVIRNVDSSRNVVEKDTVRYEAGGEMVGWTFDDITWEQLEDENQGFMEGDSVIFEIRFNLHNITGIRTAPTFDFTKKSHLNDTALIIDGQKIFVNKGILSAHSTHFDSMFYRDATEGEGDIMLDLDRKDFIELLHVIYPSRRQITDANVLALLKLAAQFDITTVLDQAEFFLISHSIRPLVPKLLLSTQFRLFRLQDVCIGEPKTLEALEELMASNGYDQLSEGIKDRLNTITKELDDGYCIKNLSH